MRILPGSAQLALLLSGIALLDWRAASAQTFSPTFSTTPGGTVTLGTGIKLTDTASLAGGLNPTGTIGFTLFNPSDFAVDAETVAVNGNGTYSTPTGYLPTQAGTYRWVGTYSGDPNNTGSTVGGGPETQLVVETTPTFSTTPGGTVTLGTGIKLTDTAFLAGGLNPTGTIGFTLFDPSDFAVDAETVPVDGNGTYSTLTGYLPTLPGIYRWVGTYSGDANNTGSTVGGESEAQLVVATPEPTAFTIVAFALGGLIAARSCRGRNGQVAM